MILNIYFLSGTVTHGEIILCDFKTQQFVYTFLKVYSNMLNMLKRKKTAPQNCILFSVIMSVAKRWYCYSRTAGNTLRHKRAEYLRYTLIL